MIVLGVWQWTHKKETFVTASNESLHLTNPTGELWNRHEILSTPVQMAPAFQAGTRHHQQAAYYEVDNHTFDIQLKKTFEYQCGKDQGIMPLSQWGAEVIPTQSTVNDEVTNAYSAAIIYIKDSIKSSKHMTCSGDYQIVHDRLTSYQKHANGKKYLFRIECIIYCPGKFHGKHVSLAVVYDPDASSKFFVGQSKVEGIVFEDAIGMFPIVPKQPMDQQSSYLEYPSNPLAPFPTITMDIIADRTVQEQRDSIQRRIAADLLVI